MRIQQIRNATLKIEYADHTILLDPWLQDKGTGFSAATVKPEMAGIKNPMNDLPMSPQEVLNGVDFCLVTHIHPDHFTEDYLPKDTHIVVQNDEDEREARQMGFRNVTAFRGDAIAFGILTIIRVPAIHGDNPVIAERMGKVSGYILTGEDKTLYIAGDTVYYDGVSETIDKHHPDVIALNCCEATFAAGRLIMNFADVESVCNKSPDSIVIATHLDSVNHALLTSDDIRALARKKGLKQIKVLTNGEWMEA